jgi:nucleoside-diphosphate-sugar epimerase
MEAAAGDAAAATPAAAAAAAGPFNVLVLGGTQFMGRVMVEQLLAGGHRVTMSNRGVSANPFGRQNDHSRDDLLTPCLPLPPAPAARALFVPACVTRELCRRE